MSIREFCRQRRVKESQFYRWQHKLKASRQERRRRADGDPGAASFALVSGDAGMTDAGIDPALRDGRRLRVRQGVDENTLRAVLAMMPWPGFGTRDLAFAKNAGSRLAKRA